MDGHNDLPWLGEPEGARCSPVLDRRHHLDFEEMVAGSERAQLPDSALPSPVAHTTGLSPTECASRFEDFEIGWHSHSHLHGPCGALRQDSFLVGRS